MLNWKSLGSIIWHLWAYTGWQWVANVFDWWCPEGDGG
jgi:hypothetical protein